MDPLASHVAARFKTGRLEASRVIEEASYIDGDGIAEFSILVGTSNANRDKPGPFYLKQRVAHFGVALESTMSLDGPMVVAWLMVALGRTLAKMGLPSSYDLTDLTPKPTVVDGVEVVKDEPKFQDSGP